MNDPQCQTKNTKGSVELGAKGCITFSQLESKTAAVFEKNKTVVTFAVLCMCASF